MTNSIFDLLAEAGIQLRGYAAGHEERWNDKLTPEPIYYSHGF